MGTTTDVRNAENAPMPNDKFFADFGLERCGDSLIQAVASYRKEMETNREETIKNTKLREAQTARLLHQVVGGEVY